MKIKILTTNKWTTDAPTNEGFYWFYGDASMGSMGCHYSDINPEPPTLKLHLVEIQKISNGVYGIIGGRFMNLRKFDRSIRMEGYLGYWTPAILPEIPEDTNRIF